MASNTVRMTHTNGGTVVVDKDKVETLERMGFTKATTSKSSK